jgi:hypothetical protein
MIVIGHVLTCTGIDFVSVSSIFLLVFGTNLTVIILVFHFIFIQLSVSKYILPDNQRQTRCAGYADNDGPEICSGRLR